MTQPRLTALAVAGFFIVATLASVIALTLLNPLTGDAAALAAAPGAVITGVLLMFAAAAAIIAIPVVFFPVLRRHSEAGALLYLAARMVEGLTYIIGGIFTVALLNAARAGESAAMTTMLKDLGDIAFATGPTLFFSLGALVLAVLLWRTRLVPRWLSGWKFLGALLMVAQGGLTLAGPLAPAVEAMLFMPIAVNEMVFALWLILKGFDPLALARLGL